VQGQEIHDSACTFLSNDSTPRKKPHFFAMRKFLDLMPHHSHARSSNSQAEPPEQAPAKRAFMIARKSGCAFLRLTGMNKDREN
jgi:hypothetical protein